MGIWIRSQDKTILINTDLVIICGKNDKGEYPIGTRDMDYFLGYYSTKEKALKVLNDIQTYINNSYQRFSCHNGYGSLYTQMADTFEMPQDKDVK